MNITLTGYNLYVKKKRPTAIDKGIYDEFFSIPSELLH